MTVQGIDVSSFQSATYSTAGLSFVFIKATEGTGYVNPLMAAQAAHARAAGCIVGFYHFLHPGNAAAQAAYFVEKAASQPGDVLACDWEPTSSGLASNADKDNFIKTVKRLRSSHRSILYCDVSRWTGVDKTGYCGDGLWIADPNHVAGHPGIKAPWLFHQYGIRGTDRDVAAFPDRAALAAWAKGATAPTPQPKPQEDDMQPIDVWAYKGKKNPAGTGPETHDAYWYLRESKTRLDTLTTQVAALTATVKTLATHLGDDVDTDQVVAAVQKAIADAVVKVSVDVTGADSKGV